ncbi:DNA alkylation repair protein [Candidatus Micrarchaeota archaeon]|nr:DNA alkylation repair protein [Candidatus Micrarchaeota archaeon]
MIRFKITSKAYGVPIPTLYRMAKKIGKNHSLAMQLWKHAWFETRVLAASVAEPAGLTEKQMEAWVKDFDSWTVCDLCCSNLFDKTPRAYEKAFEWSKRNREFEKRAGFVLMAVLAVHDKQASDAKMQRFLPVIVRESSDERVYVKKAVNWALRQLGKRNRFLNKKSIALAKRIRKQDSKAARWIANDALRELESRAVQKRLARLASSP